MTTKTRNVRFHVKYSEPLLDQDTVYIIIYIYIFTVYIIV